MYEVIAYFNGPLTTFAQSVDDREIIARHSHRFWFLARLDARTFIEQLDRTRCGCVIAKAGEVVEVVHQP